MTPARSVRGRPLAVSLVAAGFAIIGALVTTLAVIVGGQIITWDVKGLLLTGWRLALFTSALALVALTFAGAAVLIWRGARYARPVALMGWLLSGTVGFVTDRSVAGPGEPWPTYAFNMALLPAFFTAVLLYGLPASRRWLGTPPGVAAPGGGRAGLPGS